MIKANIPKKNVLWLDLYKCELLELKKIVFIVMTRYENFISVLCVNIIKQAYVSVKFPK